MRFTAVELYWFWKFRYESYDPQEIARVWPQLGSEATGSLIVVPVRNMVEGQLCGMLAVQVLKPDAMNVPLYEGHEL